MTDYVSRDTLMATEAERNYAKVQLRNATRRECKLVAALQQIEDGEVPLEHTTGAAVAQHKSNIARRCLIGLGYQLLREKIMTGTQTATLTARDGTKINVEVPEFPGNPEIIKLVQGPGEDNVRYFGNGSIEYGSTRLFYSEMEVYEINDEAHNEKPLA